MVIEREAVTENVPPASEACRVPVAVSVIV